MQKSKSEKDKKIKLIYHPKLLKIFTKEELDLIIKDAEYSVNKDYQINVILVVTDKIIAEIYTDMDAKQLDHALIENFLSYDEYKDLPAMLTKEQFWEAFQKSIPEKITEIELDE